MSKRVLTAAVTLSAGLMLAACGSDANGGSSQPPTSEAPSSAPATTEAATSSAAAESSSAAPSAAAKPVAVNKTITDPVLGNVTTVLQYVNGYQPSAAAKEKFGALEDENVVLVQVKVSAGNKYYGGLDTGDYRLTKTSNGIDETSTSILDDEVTKAGYPVLEDVDSGESGTGWVVFTPKKDYTKLVFAYKRLAYKTSDGKTISEQLFPVPLN